MLNIQNEIEFWTRIMRDHAEFQYISLSPTETESINTAADFLNLFQTLNQEIHMSNRELSPTELTVLVDKNKTAVIKFINFKKLMLTRLMKCDIELGMTPSFLNHMINEAMEYYRILCLFEETIPFDIALENIRLHKVWLPDASGHASAIASELDAIETSLIHESQYFIKKFDGLFKKAFEMYNMFKRTGLENGGLLYFNNQVELALEQFICFLEKLEKLSKECKIYKSGTTSPLIPNHMIREEKYYMYRIQNIEG